MNSILLKARRNYWVLIIFALFLIANFSYLGSVPGLMGDEGSEGQNVFEILKSKQVAVVGERSYIGVLIDYVRIPFILGLGYNAFALRLPIVIASIVFFWMMLFLLKKTFGLMPAIFGLILLTFSPIYLGEQRLAWAITLIPFFIATSIFFFYRESKYNFLLAGLFLGLGLSNHIIFLPSAVAVIVIFLISLLFRGKKIISTSLSNFWTGLISFWAGFGIQFAILQLFKEDQGNPGKVAELFSERFQNLPNLLPSLLSGSVYIARYSGQLLSQPNTFLIFYTLIFLTFLGLFISKQKKIYFLIIVGIVIHLVALLYIIDRYSLRYFVVFALSVWLVSGLSLGFLLQKISIPLNFQKIIAIVLALILLFFSANKILFPFLKTGGNTNNFPLGNREESAEALVDIKPLLSCISDKKVFSENIHIRNRLTFLTNSNNKIKLVENFKNADYIIEYRKDSVKNAREICPTLINFKVSKKK